MTHSYPGPSGTFPQLSLKPSYPRNLVLNPPSRNLQDLCWNFAWKLIWNLLWHLAEILLQFPKRCSSNVFFVREGIIQNSPQNHTGRSREILGTLPPEPPRNSPQKLKKGGPHILKRQFFSIKERRQHHTATSQHTRSIWSATVALCVRGSDKTRSQAPTSNGPSHHSRSFF